MLTIMASLKNVGVRISLDDFGTGYASLAQVNSLPLDRIKIDKSFITTMVKSQRTAEIVNTIAALGHTLDVPITRGGRRIGTDPGRARNSAAPKRRAGCSAAPFRPDAVRTFLRMSDAGISPEEGHAAVPSKLRRKG